MMQIFFVHTYNKFWLKEILKYKFPIMCMFNAPNYYLYVNWILIYNITNNDTYLIFFVEL